MSHTQERMILERNLSFVMGHPIRLRCPEIRLVTPEKLKHAYYRRAQELHPDKAAYLGLDSEYLANRFRSLQDAYSFVLESWNSGVFDRLLRDTESATSSARDASFQARPQGMYSYGTATQTKPTWGDRPSYRSTTATGGGPTHGASAAWGNSARQEMSDRSRVRIFHAGNIPLLRLRFAQYLYYSRRIDWQTLIQSLSWQYNVRPKLGDLGIELGYLDHNAVIGVLRQKKTDELFGETAVRLGYLSANRLSVLMGRQRLLNMPIGRFFVENGYLDDKELSSFLDSMTRHNYRVRAASTLR